MPDNTLHILKIGGQIIEEPAKLTETIDTFLALPGAKILVHGGGRRATRMAGQLGIPTQMVDGRRLTDAATLEVVTMVYAGLVNKTLVSRLQARGCNAIGLSGADAGSILARKRTGSEVDYGFAGDIQTVNTGTIHALLTAGLTPVFCPITHDGQGQLLNTNADTIAGRLAAALAGPFAVSLHFCFEKDGVLASPDDDTSVIPQLNRQAYDDYRQNGRIAGGMLPKLDNAFAALEQRVRSVAIGSARSIAAGKGTKLQL